MSGQDYIGSKISLISLSDIRYVGTLHSINTNNSTVSLENVRSFGTEGRRDNPEHEVKATDTVFDFVVFRGSDIKDLQVFEAPVKHAAPVHPSGSHGMVDSTMQQPREHYPPPPMNPYMMPPYLPPTHPQAMYWPSQMHPGQQIQPPPFTQHQMQPLPPSQQVPAATAMPAPPATTTAANHQQAPLAPVSKTSPQAQKQQLSPSTKPHVTQQEIDGAAVESLAKKVSELDVDTKKPGAERTIATKKTAGVHTSHPRQNKRMNGRQHRQTGQSHHRNSQRIDVPHSDFDFESSNAKFSKNDLLKELVRVGDEGEHETNDKERDYEHHQQQSSHRKEEVIIPPNDEDFYDKTKSFFDNISCESKERQDQDSSFDRRGKFQQERKLNLETFGQTSVDQSRFRNFRGRGGYRGRRSGGNYRGGGNRNYNHLGYKVEQQQQQGELH